MAQPNIFTLPTQEGEEEGRGKFFSRVLLASDPSPLALFPLSPGPQGWAAVPAAMLVGLDAEHVAAGAQPALAPAIMHRIASVVIR